MNHQFSPATPPLQRSAFDHISCACLASASASLRGKLVDWHPVADPALPLALIACRSPCLALPCFPAVRAWAPRCPICPFPRVECTCLALKLLRLHLRYLQCNKTNGTFLMGAVSRRPLAGTVEGRAQARGHTVVAAVQRRRQRTRCTHLTDQSCGLDRHSSCCLIQPQKLLCTQTGLASRQPSEWIAGRLR